MKQKIFIYARTRENLRELEKNPFGTRPELELSPSTSWIDSSLGVIVNKISRESVLMIWEFDDLGKNLLDRMDIIGNILYRRTSVYVASGLLAFASEEVETIPIIGNFVRASFGTILLTLAENERRRRSELAKRGVKTKKAGGATLGRPVGRATTVLNENKEEILRVLKMGVTKIHIAKEYGVSAATVNIWTRKNLSKNEK